MERVPLLFPDRVEVEEATGKTQSRNLKTESVVLGDQGQSGR